MAARKSKSKPQPAAGPSSNRRAVVFIALAGVLTGTTALLLALSPAPLTRSGETLLSNPHRTAAPTPPASPRPGTGVPQR